VNKQLSWGIVLVGLGLALFGWVIWSGSSSIASEDVTEGWAEILRQPENSFAVTAASFFGLAGVLLIVVHNRQLLGVLLKYGLGIGLLAWVIWVNWSPTDESPGLRSALEHPINVAPFVLAAVICLLSILLTFIRWYVLVRAQGLPFTLPNALRLGLIGYYLSTFLPGSVGGDIIKAAFIAREQRRRTVAVATVLIDRAVGLCGLFWLVTLLGSIFWLSGSLDRNVQTLNSILLGAALLSAGSLVFWFVLGWLPQYRAERFAGRLSRIPKIGHALAEFWRAVWMYRCQGRSVFVALVMAVIGHVGFVLTFYFSAMTLVDPEQIPSLADHFLLVPVGMAIQAGFPAPGGVGGGEYGYGKLYSLLGYPFANGVLGSLVQRVITWVLAMGGYLVYLRMRPALRPVREQAEKELAVSDT
jgi:uncharacterized protein (TIRG00374 family)